jgi:hypothetical protein
MDRNDLQTVAARDQLWASLRVLRPAIERLAAGEWEDTEPQRALIRLVARIVAAELAFRDDATRE